MRNSFLLYFDQMGIIEKLTDEQNGKLLKAIVRYAAKQELIQLETPLDLVFFPIKNHLDRDREKYSKIIEIKIAAGKKGGLAKASKASACQLRLAKLAKLAVPVSVSVSDSVNNICSSGDERVCDGFKNFWEVYPRKQNKKLAEETWRTKKLAKKRDEILADVKERLKQKPPNGWLGEPMRYVPVPAKYLENESWDDVMASKIVGG